MSAKRKIAKTKKPHLKVRDLKSAKDTRGGGRKAGKGQQEYLTVKMADVIVSG